MSKIRKDLAIEKLVAEQTTKQYSVKLTCVFDVRKKGIELTWNREKRKVSLAYFIHVYDRFELAVRGVGAKGKGERG